MEPSGLREVKVKVIVLKLGTNTPSIIGKSIDNIFRTCSTMNASIRGSARGILTFVHGYGDVL